MKMHFQHRRNTRLLLIVLAVCFFFAGNAMANTRHSYDWQVVKTNLKHSNLDDRRTFYKLSQNETSLRSRSDVVAEVKKRYNAKVLKISLNNKKTHYAVRVLMPNGKVRNLKISAQR